MAGLELPMADWPVEDRSRWEAAFEEGDRFDEGGRGAHLADHTRLYLRRAYARFLTFISECHPERLGLAPHQRIDHETVAEYLSLIHI